MIVRHLPRCCRIGVYQGYVYIIGGKYRLTADGTGGLRLIERVAEQVDAPGVIGAALKPLPDRLPR